MLRNQVLIMAIFVTYYNSFYLLVFIRKYTQGSIVYFVLFPLKSICIACICLFVILEMCLWFIRAIVVRYSFIFVSIFVMSFGENLLYCCIVFLYSDTQYYWHKILEVLYLVISPWHWILLLQYWIIRYLEGRKFCGKKIL